MNDLITNDLMLLKRELIDVLIIEGINKFALIEENVLNIQISILMMTSIRTNGFLNWTLEVG